MTDELQRKVDRAVKLIQQAGRDAIPEVAYSGGKDSDVILELARMSGIEFRAIYRNTTIDPPGTIKHVLERGAEMVRPKLSFLQIMEKKGIPSRYMRFCCSELKEYKILDRCIMGIRREESVKRKENYREPTECRLYKHSGETVEAIYPILDWTLKDVVDFLKYRNITCAPVYYDEQGNFHPERRLGCMCCPLGSRNHRIAEFKKYKNMVKMYIRGGGKWLDNHPNAKQNPVQSDIFRLFVRTTFFDTNEDFMLATEDMFGKIDCKHFLMDYFGIDL